MFCAISNVSIRTSAQSHSRVEGDHLAVDDPRGNASSLQIFELNAQLAIKIPLAGIRAHGRDEPGMPVDEGAPAREGEWNDGAGLHGLGDRARAWLFNRQSRPPFTSLVSVYARLITPRAS
jgi:hypothetical protein